jgi:hypothetical protein
MVKKLLLQLNLLDSYSDIIHRVSEIIEGEGEFPCDYVLDNIAVCQKLRCKVQEQFPRVTWSVFHRLLKEKKISNQKLCWTLVQVLEQQLGTTLTYTRKNAQVVTNCSSPVAILFQQLINRICLHC